MFTRLLLVDPLERFHRDSWCDPKLLKMSIFVTVPAIAKKRIKLRYGICAERQVKI